MGWESTSRGQQQDNDRIGADLQYHPEVLHNNTGTQEGAASQGYRGFVLRKVMKLIVEDIRALSKTGKVM